MSGHIQGRFEAYRGDQPFLFACYAHEDREDVFPDIEYLHAHGYGIWYQGDKDSSDNLFERISDCSYFLVFLSPKALKSRFVKQEVLLGVDLKKPILAVSLCELNSTRYSEFSFLSRLKRYKQSREEYLGRL